MPFHISLPERQTSGDTAPAFHKPFFHIPLTEIIPTDCQAGVFRIHCRVAFSLRHKTFEKPSQSDTIVRPSVYYDALLKSVILTANGERFVIEFQGKDILLAADSANAAYYDKLLKQSGKEETGLIGLVSQVRKKNGNVVRSRGFYRFDAYPDQTLTRAFELDDFEYLDEGCNMNCIGWRNQANPNGFLAARGIIPGTEGRFISDRTERYPVNIPFEFVEIATRLKQDPVDMLKNFMADVCQLHSTDELPRADSLNSRGTEAEKKAREYLRQAYRLKKDVL